MIKFIKRWPKSSKFVLSLLTFGIIALVGDGSAITWIAVAAFIFDIFHFYAAGGAGDE